MKQKKEKRITLRVTPEQYETIQAKAEAAHMSTGAYVRAAALRHRVVVIDKVSPTPKKYPRRFAQIKKQPLGCPPADKETPGGKT